MSDPEIYDLFTAPAPDPATVEYQLYETKTDPSILGSNFVQTNTGTIRLLTRDIDSWCRPHEAILKVEFQIAKDGATPIDSDIVTLCNGGWNLFKDVQINLNGKMVDRIDHPGKVQLMKSYAQDANYFDSQSCDNSWFYPEVASRGDASDAAGTTVQVSKYLGSSDPFSPPSTLNDGTNALAARYSSSYRKRWLRTKAGAKVELWLRLADVSGFCDNIDKVIRGVSLEVVLNRDTEWNKIIHRSKGLYEDFSTVRAVNLDQNGVAVFTAVVNQVSLWMPRVVPSQAVASALEAQLAASAQTRYMFDQATCYQSEEYQQGTTNVRWKIVSEAHRPVLALIGFQHERQYKTMPDLANPRGDLTAADIETYAAVARAQNGVANASIFSRLADITQIELRVNQRIVPVESYRISFTDESCVRAYHDFRKAFGKDDPKMSSVMSFDTWRDSPIFAFDLSMIGDDNIYGGIKTNDIELRATLSSLATGAGTVAVGTGNFQVFCVLMTEVEMKVDAVNGRLVYVP